MTETTNFGWEVFLSSETTPTTMVETWLTEAQARERATEWVTGSIWTHTARVARTETMTLREVADEAILDLEAQAAYQGRDPDA